MNFESGDNTVEEDDLSEKKSPIKGWQVPKTIE